MLKSNSKQARANIRQYIIDHYCPENYSLPFTTDFEEVAKQIDRCFMMEQLAYNCRYLANRTTRYREFNDWTRGLPSLLNCSYWMHRAKDDLAHILQEDPTEQIAFTRYSEDDAAEVLTKLIYREIERR